MAEIDNFKFPYLIGSKEIPFGGYVSSIDKTNMNPNLLVEGSLNVYKNTELRIANRPGRLLRGIVDGTNAGVKSSYEWSDSLGRTFPLRTTEEDKLQVEIFHDGEYRWFDLLDTLSSTRFIYTPWWYGLKPTAFTDYVGKDLLLMVHGEPNIKLWSGGVAEILSYSSVQGLGSVSVASGGTGYTEGDVITVTGGGGTGGTVLVNGVMAGVVVSISRITPGSGYTSTVGAATTGGTGSGLTVTFTQTTVYQITKTGTQTWRQVGFLDDDADSSYGNLDDLDKIMINGNEYNPTEGWDTTTITVTTDPTGEAVGSLAFSKVVTVDNIELNQAGDTMETVGYNVDFMNILNNQILIGSYSNPTLYLSFNAMFSIFTQGNDLIIGDPDNITLDSLPTGIASRKGDFVVMGGTSDFYIVTPNSPLPVAIPTGGGEFNLIQTKVEKQSGADLTSAISQEFITTVGDDVIFLSQDQQVRVLGNFKDLFVPKFPSISQEIRSELAAEDFTDGALRAVGDDIYVTAPVSGKVYIREARDTVNAAGNIVSEIEWNPPQQWNVSRIAIINGVIYGHSYVNPQMYQLWDTNQWHDDTPDGPQAYASIASFAYWNFNDKTKLGNFDKAYFEGLILQGSDLQCEVLFDYEGAKDIQNKVISGGGFNPPIYAAPGTSMIGGSVLGEEMIGGGFFANGNNLSKFRIIKTFQVKDCFEYQISLFSTIIDSQWELICAGTNGKQIVNNPVSLLSNN